MSGGGGETRTQTTTASSEPWSAQKEYLTRGFQEAQQNVLDRPLEYYGGSTVTPLAPQTQQALSMAENRALTGNPLLSMGQGQMMDTLGGGYLNSQIPTDAVTAAVRPAIDSQFSGSGRYGSGLHAQAMAQGMARGIAPYAFNAYENERGRQMQAAGAAPGMAMADYADIGQLGNVGAAYQQQGQMELQDQINRFNFGQEEPYNRLARYMGLIGGNYGGTQTQSTMMPMQGGNPLLTGLGVMSTGVGMANTLFNPTGGLFPGTF